MQLDPRTLALYTTAISLLLAVLAFVYGRTRRVYPGFGWWVASLLLFGLALGSIGLRGLVPDWLDRLGPSALGMATVVAIIEGHRRFVGLPRPAWSAVGFSLAVLLLMLLSHDDAHPERYRAIGAAGVGILLLQAAWRFLSWMPPGLRGAGRWCALLMLMFSLIRIARSGQLLLEGSGFDVLAPELSSILSYTSNAFFVTLWGFGFLFLCGARLEQELDDSREALRELSRTDVLTGVLNRRAFFDDTRSELERARRYPAATALLMLDVDHFKSVNDQHGHQVGDRLLAAIAQRLKQELRSSDLLGRIGGEEFAVLLVQTPRDQALAIAGRLRAAVAQTTCLATDGATVQRTVSIGLVVAASPAPALEALVREADAALYRAKEAGRDQVTH